MANFWQRCWFCGLAVNVADTDKWTQVDASWSGQPGPRFRLVHAGTCARRNFECAEFRAELSELVARILAKKNG